MNTCFPDACDEHVRVVSMREQRGKWFLTKCCKKPMMLVYVGYKCSACGNKQCESFNSFACSVCNRREVLIDCPF